MAINNSDTLLEEINDIVQKHASTMGLEDIPVVFRSVKIDPDAYYPTGLGLTTINGHKVLESSTWGNWKYDTLFHLNETIETRIEDEIWEENRRQYKFEKYSYLKGVNFSLCTDPESPVYSSDLLKGYGKMPEFETYEQVNNYVVTLEQDAENLTEILESKREQDSSTIPSFLRISCTSAFPGWEYLIVTVKKDYDDTELEEMYDLIETHTNIEDVPVIFKLGRRDQIDHYFESDVENATENQNTENQNSLNGFHAYSTLIVLVFGTYVFFRGKESDI